MMAQSTPSSDELQKKLYYDKKFGLSGLSTFVTKVRQQHPEIKATTIREFVKKQQLHQVNSKPQNTSNSYKIVDPPHHYQIDLFFLPAFKYSNNGVFIYLIILDILSRMMFIYPLKNKSKTQIMDKIIGFHKKHELKGLAGDDEFNFKSLSDYCEKKNIILSTSVSSEEHFSKYGNKLGIVDAAVKNIKRLIRNFMTTQKTAKYIDVLQDLVSNYNTTPHSSLLKMAPSEVYKDPDFQNVLKQRLESLNADTNKQINLDIGDIVRKAIDKAKFSKEGLKFSPELYTIHDMDGYRYVLQDMDGKIHRRRFKHVELLKVDDGIAEGDVDITSMKSSEKHRRSSVKLSRDLGITDDEASKMIARMSKEVVHTSQTR